MSMKIILLPGLGADARLLSPQKTAFPDLIVLPWLKPENGESLPAYAARLAKVCEATVGKEPFVLGGVSFGGMLALEMAQHLNPKAVFLIASSRTGKSLKRLHDFFRVILPRLPLGVFAFVKKRIAPFTMHRLGKMNPDQRKICLDMLRDTDINFFAWATKALLNWSLGDELTCPIYAIHGERDVIIPLKKVRADVVVPGGGHVINLTHADVVNRFILERVTAISKDFAP